MKELTLYVAVLLLGFSVMIFAISYYETTESAQKIENIKTLYELKSNLENKKFNEDRDRWIKETQKKIASLENENKTKDFTVECNVCKQWYDNWVGSTPCCGSIAFQVNRETGEVSKDFFLYAQVNKEKINTIKINQK